MEKEPWKFSAEKAAVIKRFLRLRHRLVPWLYSQNHCFAAKNEMLLRPMYFDSPQDRAAYHASNQYMLGDCMTVCPVTQPMDRAAQLAPTKVYLPDGVWTDFFTGDRYTGGRELNMYRPLDLIPVLVKAGGILPMDGDEIPKNGVLLPDHLLVRCFAAADGEALLIEDNGKLPNDPAYNMAETQIYMHCGEGLQIVIDPVKGERMLIPADRRYTVEIYGIGNESPNMCSCGYTASYVRVPVPEPVNPITVPDALYGAILELISAF